MAYPSIQSDDDADVEDGVGRPGRPLQFRELASGEQLTLWSVRAIALGHAECSSLQRAFHVALGSAAEEAFTALFLAVRTLGWCARRRLRLHAPGCERVSADERILLGVFAAAQQAGIDGDEACVRLRLQALVEPRLLEGLLTTLQAAASTLEVNGYPLRSGQPAASDRWRLH